LVGNVIWYIPMIFPVYRTELELPLPEDALAGASHLSEYDFVRLYGRGEVVGKVAVGAEVLSASHAYELGTMPTDPPIEREYEILSKGIYVARLRLAELEEGELLNHGEIPLELKAHGRIHDVDVAIAGLYYRSNQHIGWMNIQPRVALYQRMSDDDQRKMLEL